MKYAFWMTRSLYSVMFVSATPARYLYFFVVVLAAFLSFQSHIRPTMRRGLWVLIPLWLVCELFVDLFCAEVFTYSSIMLLLSDVGSYALLFAMGVVIGLLAAKLYAFWKNSRSAAGEK